VFHEVIFFFRDVLRFGLSYLGARILLVSRSIEPNKLSEAFGLPAL